VRIWLGDFPTLHTVRISAAGQTLGAVISPWVCALALSVPLRTAPVDINVPNFAPLAAATKTVPGPTPNGGWESRETRRHTLCASVHGPFRVCRLQKVLCSQRGACRFRVHPPGQHLAFSLSYCAARKRVGSLYAGDGDLIRQVQVLFALLYVRNGVGILRFSSISHLCTDRLLVTLCSAYCT
jgi:hypothetical protein